MSLSSQLTKAPVLSLVVGTAGEESNPPAAGVSVNSPGLAGLGLAAAATLAGLRTLSTDGC